MTVTVVLTTLNAEMSASRTTGTQHAPYTGQTMQTLPATVLGMQFSHATAALTLPRLTGSGHMAPLPHASAAATLPSPLTCSANGGASAALTLPLLTGASSGTNTIHGSLASTLPKLTGAAHALTGFMAEGAATLPLLRLVSYCGARSNNTLPRLLGTSAGRTDNHATVAQWLPRPPLYCAAVGHRSAEAMHGAMTLPKLVAGQQVRVAVNLPRMLCSATAQNGAPVVTGGWVFNCERAAVTALQNFAFIALVRFKDKEYGIGRDGNFYLLGGDTDNGAVIPWAFETGLHDLDSAAQKGVRAVYLDGVMERGVDLTIVTDTGARYVYATTNTKGSVDHRTYRVVTGKGIRSRNFAFGLSSTSGAYAELDSMAPKYDISKRSVG